MSAEDEHSITEWPDPIFRLPRPWWQHLFACLVGLVLFAIALTAEWVLLRPAPLTFKDRGGVERRMVVANRWFHVGLWGILLVAAPLFPLSYALTSPLVIRKLGLELDRRNRQQRPAVWAFEWSFGLLYSTVHRLATLERWELRITSWEQIGPCHWGRYNRGTLTIPGPDGLVFIPIPESYRLEVETAIRQFGKWQD